MTRSLLLGSALAAIIAGYASGASATLTGDSFTVERVFSSSIIVFGPITQTVPTGTMVDNGLTNITISANSIMFTFVPGGGVASYSPDNVYEFIDNTNSDISGVTIDPSTSWPGFTASDISFTGNEIDVQVGGLDISSDNQLTLDVATGPASVPEPLTLSLFGAGLVGAVRLRRRKALATPHRVSAASGVGG